MNDSKKMGEFRSTLRRFKKNRLAVGGAWVVILLIVIALFAPLVSPYNPYKVDLEHMHSGPSRIHPLGTDHLGRDILSNIIYGTRVSLLVGVLSVMVSLFFGVISGLFAGYYGGRTDTIIMRVLDIVWAFPPLLLAMALIAVKGAGLTSVIFSIGLVGIPGHARIVRGSVLSAKEKDYILAARSSGLRDLQIIFTHIFPNVMAPIIVVSTLGIAFSIMIEAILSFLGLGMQPPASSWGLMLKTGQSYLREHPSMSIFPGLAIMITVFGFNTMGDGLRDCLDPKLKT